MAQVTLLRRRSGFVNALGECAIFASGDPFACEILLHASGRPQLRGSSRKAPVLERVR